MKNEKRIIKEVRVTKNLKIVIREWNEITPFVVHTFNIADGAYHNGKYCETLIQAERVLEEKVLIYL